MNIRRRDKKSRRRRQRDGLLWGRRGLLLALIGLFSSCSFASSTVKKEEESGAHYKLGLAHLEENRPDLQKASVEFLKAVEADPKNKQAHYALGHLYAERSEYEKAIASFKNALAIDPNFSEAHNYLGKIYGILEKDEEAILAYQAAIKNAQYATPQFPHWNMGLLYFRKKEYDKALAAFQEARRMDPKNAEILVTIGETHLKMGQPEKAVLFFQEAALLAPDDPQTHYRLASFYLQEARLPEAREVFLKIIKQFPESIEAQESRRTLQELP